MWPGGPRPFTAVVVINHDFVSQVPSPGHVRGVVFWRGNLGSVSTLMSKAGNDFWYEGDHIQGGSRALTEWGYPREDLFMASAGYGGNGEPQVLALGYNNLRIVNGHGEVDLEVAHRGVRGVRAVDNLGVRVHIAPGTPSFFSQSMWTHLVADNDARYLENTWFIVPTHHHNGSQLNPLHWKEEDYAYYVGRVITEGARCDSTLIGLAMMARPLLELPQKRFHGASGTQLAEAFEELGEISPPLEDLKERYVAWYERRNLTAHGFRLTDPDGRPHSQVYKPNKGQGKQPPEVLFEIEEQDFADLAKIWRAFYYLNYDATQASLHLSGAARLTFNAPRPSKEATVKILEELPWFNSVSESERLPPSKSSNTGSDLN